MFLDSLLAWETVEFFIPVFNLSRNLVTDTKRSDDSSISIDILLIEVVQETTALVDKCDQSTSGGKVLGVNLEVGGQVVDTLRHAGNLVFWAASIGFVSSVLDAESLDAVRGSVPRRWLAIVRNAILVVVRLQVTDINNVVLGRDRFFSGRNFAEI
jgi:multidrug efflux pump subunit AcrA (membrane-fusion protein)